MVRNYTFSLNVSQNDAQDDTELLVEDVKTGETFHVCCD
jgi:hypothetical protein